MLKVGATPVVILIGWLGVFVPAANSNNVPPPELQFPEEMRLTLGDFFSKAGMRFDCYFTMEEISTDEAFRSHYGLKVTGFKKVHSKDEMVAQLTEELKDMKVTINPKNSAIINLVDAKLEKELKYVLDKKVSIDYSGSLYDMLWQLSKKAEGIQPPAGGSIGTITPIDVDLVTQVKIFANQKPVREILTDFVPLSKYQRVLWIAKTKNIDGAFQTTVRYAGQIHPGSLKYQKTTEPLDFSLGEISYLHNKYTFRGNPAENSTHLAIDFINTRMKTGQVLQVRWAMLFLGKCAADEGIPVLVKYIGYNYTTCGIIEESYPAVQALAEIGDSAASVVLKEISTETNELRLRLMCKVLFMVKKTEKAKALLNAEISQQDNQSQKERLRAALEWCISEKM